ncbi:hypothetical protein M3Y95_00191800 [Aphelenchoides besseyi]|nr:hypothetical protein M3Y95_00191800 [Aphelenchoides besseyi]
MNARITSIFKSVKILREGFESGINSSIESRKKHLKQLKDMLIENEEAFVKAVYDDLHKCRFEVLAHEIDHVISDIDFAISNLKSWISPTRVTRYLLQATDSAYTIREPLGTVLIIGSYNFPIQLLLGPLVGAIAGGNTVLLKPSEMAANTERVVLDLVQKYFDPGLLKAVHADKNQMKRVLEIRFDHIFFTGSLNVGKKVMLAASENVTSLTLELGGKSPTVIDADVDLPTAARRITWGKFTNAGQVCVSPDFAICIGNAERRSAFTAECVKAVIEFYGGDAEKSEDYGRIINDANFDRLEKLLKESKGKVIHGGETNRSERYIQPTIIEVDLNDSTMSEECFGPILPVLQFECLDDAIKMIRRREKPLVCYLFTESKKTVQRFESEVSSGTLTVNDTIMHMGLNSLPFGGIGQSGIGRYHGWFSFEAFTHEKAVLHRSLRFEKLLWMRYPPFSTEKLNWVKRITSRIPMPF